MMIIPGNIALAGDEAECVARQLHAEDLNDQAPTLVPLPEGDLFIEDDDARNFLSHFTASAGRGIWLLRSDSTGASPPSNTLLEKALPRLNASLTKDLPTDPSVISDVIAALNAVDRTDGAPLGDKEIDILAQLLAEAIELGSLAAFRQTAEHAANRMVSYDLLTKGVSATTTRAMEKRDLLATLAILVAIGRLKQVLAPFDATRVARIIPNAPRIVDLVSDIIAGRCTIVFDPAGVPRDAGAVYQANVNVLALRDIILSEKVGLASEGVKNPLTFDNVAVHELVHVVQDKERRALRFSVAEREAFAVQHTYGVLRQEKTSTKRTGDPIAVTPGFDGWEQGQQQMINLFGRKAMDHLDRLYRDSSMAAAGESWARKALVALRGSGEIPPDVRSASIIEETYIMPQAIEETGSVMWNAQFREMIERVRNATSTQPFRSLLLRWVEKDAQIYARPISVPLPDDLHELGNNIEQSARALSESLEYFADKGDVEYAEGQRLQVPTIIAQMLVYAVVRRKQDRTFDVARYFDTTILPLAATSIRAKCHSDTILGLGEEPAVASPR